MAGAKAVSSSFGHLSMSSGSTDRSLGPHNYQVVRSIGRGSFGEATLVRCSAGKYRVMKTIDIKRLDKEQQLDAVNEVKVLSSLKHPYIVRYHESFVEDGTLAIVMDYAEGGDLSRRISRHREKQQLFTEGQILRWFTQVALGLKYLHARHIVHRDLKPQNIFLTKQDDLRLGDFGISKTLETSSKKEETTIGTPYYFSPEICRERLYSFASDIWALGCILYELAALHVPFEAQNIPCLIRKITGGRLPSLPASFSGELRQLSHDLLCRDYVRRPSAAVVLQSPMIQTEMRQMMQDVAVKASACVCGSIMKPDATFCGSCGKRCGKADASASPPLGENGPSKVIELESRERRMLGSFLKPLVGAPTPNMDMKRSPSAPVPSPAGNKTLRHSVSNALMSSNGAVKTAWGCEDRAQTPAMHRDYEEGVPGCNKVSGKLNSLNVKRTCASPLLGKLSHCGANRGRSRRRPALPVWQDIH